MFTIQYSHWSTLYNQNPINMKKLYFILLVLVLLGHQRANAQCKMMIDQDFNHWEDRKYTVADAKSDFNDQVKPWTASTYRGISAPGADASLIGNVAQESWIVNGELRAEYKKNDAGGYAGGFLFDPYFEGVEEAYLEYKVKFDDNFFWATGGKLPGLGGSSSGVGSETTGRGTIPSGCKYNTNGWSARLMWRRNRAQTTQPYLILYSYFAEKENGENRVDGDCGDAKRIYTGLEDNTWYTIRQYIKLNTPGQNDGIVTMWINGVETYHNTKEKIRNAGKDNLKINALIMNTYRGGSRTDPVWHSPRDEYAFFDDFKVWTGCSEPPTVTNQAPTASFEAPTSTTIQEGYDALYINVSAEDPDGDAITATLKIDETEIRTESVAPYEWGHATSPNKDETVGLTVGEHTLQVIVTDSKGASTTISKTIVVERTNLAPEVEITSPSHEDIFLVGEQINIVADATDDLLINKVNFKINGAYHSQDKTPSGLSYSTTFTPTEAGTYTLGARAFDEEGESTEVSINIIVTIPTNMTTNSTTEVKLFPNPTTNGMIYFNHICQWELFSTQGIKLAQGSSTELDLSNYSKGVYLIKTDDQKITVFYH